MNASNQPESLNTGEAQAGGLIDFSILGYLIAPFVSWILYFIVSLFFPPYKPLGAFLSMIFSIIFLYIFRTLREWTQ